MDVKKLSKELDDLLSKPDYQKGEELFQKISTFKKDDYFKKY